MKLSYLTIEDHLEEYCPKCKKKHGSDWKVTFSSLKTVLFLDCPSCDYLIYKKIDIMTSGSKQDIQL